MLEDKAESHKPSVCMEFYTGINYPDETHATMYRDERYKLIRHHGKNLFELNDLHEDRWEHQDLSNELDPVHFPDLLIESQDTTVLAHLPTLLRSNPF